MDLAFPVDGTALPKATRSMDLETSIANLPAYMPAFAPAFWDDPDPSDGFRRPSARSRGSARASLAVGSGDVFRVLHVESGLEYDWAVVIDGLMNPQYLVEQPETVQFYDFDGTLREHTFDFFLLTSTARRIYIQVKPLEIVERYLWEPTIELIASQMSADDVDEVLLLTDAELHPDTIANAKLLRHVRRCPPHDAENVVLELAEKASGFATIGDLVASSGLDGIAFVATLRLVDRGRLVVLDEGRIGYGSRVRVAEAASGEAEADV
ncbi:hypothetical protein [Methylobacterium isbiliense]|nr:hypothetical protein [Methylobacterium isbiliense]MDN3626018.1 hypothetical protein [Methylobacterium isbiliense]